MNLAMVDESSNNPERAGCRLIPATSILIINGNPFPSFNGEALSWAIGLYYTINEANAGYPRMRTVIRAMAEHRPAQLEDERRILRQTSFDRIFGNAARK